MNEGEKLVEKVEEEGGGKKKKINPADDWPVSKRMTKCEFN